MRSDERYIRLLTRYHIDVIVRFILTITTVSLLMLPSAVLYILPEHRALKIVLVLLFTLLFSSALAVFTKAYVTPIPYARIPSVYDEEVERRQGSWYPRKRHEQFAATAA